MDIEQSYKDVSGDMGQAYLGDYLTGVHLKYKTSTGTTASAYRVVIDLDDMTVMAPKGSSGEILSWDQIMNAVEQANN